MDSQHQEPEHFKKFTFPQHNRWNTLRFFMTKYLMNGDSSKYLQLDQRNEEGKIIFRYTPEPVSNELAFTQNGVDITYEWEKPIIGLSNKVLEMKGDNGQPLACYSTIVLFHEIAHAAIHYDKDLTVKFQNQNKEFKAKLDILMKQDINPLYLEAAKKAHMWEMKCISPRGCEICDKYKSELAGTSVGRPRKRKGGRKRLNQ